jgi:hypothetical protein
MRRRDAPQFGRQRRILAAPAATITLRGPWLSNYGTGPALAYFQLVLHMQHGLAFVLRAYHFPSATSLRIDRSSA